MKGILQIFEYREMLKTTVSKELRARYKGSMLGFLWTFINPLLQLAIYAIVFKYIMRVNVPGVSYTLFLFVGIVVWSNFSSTLVMSSTVVFSNSNLIKKVYFPRPILPISSVAGNLINMLLSMCIVLPVLWISGYGVNINYLYLPLILLLQAMLNLGFAFFLSSLYVYFRDLEHILSVLLMAWLYVSPVIYADNMVPGRFLNLYKLNPMYPVITTYQRILLFNTEPNPQSLLYLFAFALFFLFLGYTVFDKLQRRFAEEL